MVISGHKNQHPLNEEVTLAVSKLFWSLTTETEASNRFDLQSKYNFYSWVQPVVFLKEIHFRLQCEKQNSSFKNIRNQAHYHKSIEKKKETNFIFQSQMMFRIKMICD